MRRVFCVLAPLLVAGYLYAQWSDWFTRVELWSVGKRPLFSNHIDLRRPGPIEWRVPREEWSFQQGQAHLSLSLNLNTLREIPAGRKQVELRVKVRAEGRVPRGDWQDRLVRDWYFTTDEPFSKPDLALWEKHGMGRLEYGLAGVQVVDGEELRITVDVQVPDGMLQTGSPRLKLVGEHDSAGIPYAMVILYVMRQGGFWLCLGLVVVLAVLAWRPAGARSAAKKKGRVAAEPLVSDTA
jgi:hypothetical protein